LTDEEFEEDPLQSKRSRNWFRVNWNIMALDMNYRISPLTEINSRTFGLIAGRDALGVLERIDWNEEDLPAERNLIKSDFRNWGNETRLIHRYMIGDEVSAFLTGFRYYKGDTEKNQGSGTTGSDADFNFLNKDNRAGSFYTFPSTNASLFVENLFKLNSRLSVTPGLRYEYISTESDGFIQADVNDRIEKIYNQRSSSRNVFLYGLGLSYMWKDKLESYINFSKNYRAINFNDMEITNPSVVIDPDLKDEEGFNLDVGLRGEYKGFLDFDVSLYYLDYSDRIGFVQRYYGPEAAHPYTSYRFRTNVADSRTIGMESYVSVEYYSLRGKKKEDQYLKFFGNLSLQNGKYVDTDEITVKDKKIESVPDILMKYGVLFGYKKWSASLLYSYTGAQFADAQNTVVPTANALFGEIPSYSVMDFSMKYRMGKLQWETGINNLLDESYYTRRADGYPGPGIVPSQERSWYITLQLTL
jgi:Fe(3+) dicitrate transport protein